VSGRRDDALQIVNQLHRIASHRYVPALYFALLYTGLSDRDQAFHWMNAAVKERTGYLIYLGTEPVADPLRSDQRFPGLVRQVGIPLATVPHLAEQELGPNQ
jgi:hypothetical protein